MCIYSMCVNTQDIGWIADSNILEKAETKINTKYYIDTIMVKQRVKQGRNKQENKWRKLCVNNIYFHIILTKEWDPVSYESCKFTKEAEWEEKKNPKWNNQRGVDKIIMGHENRTMAPHNTEFWSKNKKNPFKIRKLCKTCLRNCAIRCARA